MFNENKVTAVLEEIIARWGIPGLGVGIVEDGEIVYARGFGVQSLETRRPGHARFDVLCGLHRQVFRRQRGDATGRAGQTRSWMRRSSNTLPYFRLDDDRYRQITLRQMLSHTSGMPDMDEDEYDELVAHPEDDEGAPERYVRTLTSRKMIAAPGERFRLQQHCLQRAGRPDRQNLRPNLRRRTCGSTSCARPECPKAPFSSRRCPRDRLAVPHLRTPEMIVNPVYPYHRADAPASFLHSTVVEMCHWAITCLNWGDVQRTTASSHRPVTT